MRSIIGITSAGVVFIMCLAASGQASTEFYRDPSLPNWAPFSSAAIHGETIYLSGHLGRDPATNELVSGGAGPETRQTMLNIQRTLKAVGADLNDIVKCTVFLDDVADYGVMNEAYREFFDTPPARSMVGADGLAIGAAVEIECIAAKPE